MCIKKTHTFVFFIHTPLSSLYTHLCLLYAHTFVFLCHLYTHIFCLLYTHLCLLYSLYTHLCVVYTHTFVSFIHKPLSPLYTHLCFLYTHTFVSFLYTHLLSSLYTHFWLLSSPTLNFRQLLYLLHYTVPPIPTSASHYVNNTPGERHILKRIDYLINLAGRKAGDPEHVKEHVGHDPGDPGGAQ